MKILVSACLLGIACRYDGDSKTYDLADLLEKYDLIPFCPECYGGLPTPRAPSEIVGERVLSENGTDVTAQYERGARLAAELCEKLGIRYALLKAKSPSCGSGKVYDGTFSGALTDGDGITAHALKKNGIRIYTETEIERLKHDIKGEKA